MKTRHIRSGDHSLVFHQLVETLRPGRKRHHPPVGVEIQVDQGKHLASNGLVPDPEDEIVAPLRCLFDEWEFAEEVASTFGVHGENYPSEAAALVRHPGTLGLPRIQQSSTNLELSPTALRMMIFAVHPLR